MRVEEAARTLGLRALAAPRPELPVTGGFCSDLLSRTMAEAEAGDAWITYHRHLNIVAVAKLKELSMVIIARGPEPESEVVSRAAAEGVNLFLSEEGAFELAGRLFLLLRGREGCGHADRGERSAG
ncbi:hypothetical protein ACVNPS_08835 [Candidatus Bipolaricaulota sp. J31]